MPISDQVIELETKKKGRNVIFIVLISILAAASVAFAVLWVTKAPAVDPPSIEKISVHYTDLCQKGVISNDTGDTPLYTVAPTGEYTIDFDLSLKEGTTVDEVNALLDIRSEPAGLITTLSGGGLDPDNPTRYTVHFAVNKNARGEFNLIAESQYSKGVTGIIRLIAENPYTDLFDIPLVGEEHAKSQVLQGLNLQTDAQTRTYRLQEDAEKSNDTTHYYKAAERMLYYQAPFTDSREMFRLSFEQWGLMGQNGQRQKILADMTGTGGMLDEVQIWVADKANPAESDYKQITDSSDSTDNIRVYFGRMDANGKNERYCHANLWFAPKGQGTSTIKLLANAYNGGPSRAIVLEVTFVSSNAVNNVSEIIYTDPYTGIKSSESGGKDELDLFLGNFKSSEPFELSQFISVVRGGNEVASSWGQGSLMGAVTDAHGNMTASDGKPITSLLGSRQTADEFFIYPLSDTATGTAYVTLQDTDRQGFSVSKTITVHVRPAVETLLTAPVNSETFDNSATVYAHSGDETVAALRYTLVRGTTATAVKNDVTPTLAVRYPADKAVSPVFSQNTAGTTGTNTITNADSAIIVRANNTNIGRDMYVTPAFSESKDPASLLSSVTFVIGSKVPNDNYEFTFVLSSQGLTKGENGYTSTAAIECKVTVSVTRLATSISLEAPEFSEDDKWSVFTPGSGGSAKLTLIAGTGILAAGTDTYVTSFSVKDMLRYYENGVEMDDNMDANFNEVKYAAGSGYELDNILHDGKFVVPEEVPMQREYVLSIMLRNYTFKLTVEYKYVVGRIEINGVTSDKGEPIEIEANTEYYLYEANKANQLLHNGVIPVRLYSTNGKSIADDTLLKSEDTNKLSFDVAVLRAQTAWTVLPKKLIGDPATGSIYYFYPGTPEEEQTAENAILRTGYTNILKGHNLTMLKDLFSLSVVANNQYDFQNLRLYYSYNLDINDTNLLVNERDVVTGVADPALVQYYEYHLVRAFNDLRLYADSHYTSVLQDEATFNYSSGSDVPVYYSGIVALADYTDIIDGALDVSEDASVWKNLAGVTQTNSGYELILSLYTQGNFATRTIVVETDGEGASHLDRISDRLFRISCTQEESKSSSNQDGRVNAGTIVVATRNVEGQTILQRRMNLTVTNTILEVEDIAFYTDDTYTVKLEKDVILQTNGGAKELNVYYMVTYKEYDKRSTEFEEFAVFFDASTYNKVNAVSASFTKDPFTGERISQAPQFKATPESLNVQEGAKYTHKGQYKLTLQAEAQNGKHTFTVKTENIIATLDIEVTTAIESAAVKLDDSDDLLELKATEGGAAVVRRFTYDAATAANNMHTLDFVFAPDGTDTANLTYTYAWDADNDSALIGAFYENANNAYTATCVSGADATVKGFRFAVPDKVLDNQVLTLTVTETIDGTAKTYTLQVIIYVQVTVRNIQVQIGAQGSVQQLSDKATYAVDTSGRTDTLDIPLAAVLNGGDANRQPDVTPAFSISDSEVFALNGNALRVDCNKANSDPSATATLTVTASDKTITVTLEVATRTIAFNSAVPSKVTDNKYVNYSAVVTHAGVQVQGATVTYSVTALGGTLSPAQENTTTLASRIRPNGSAGTMQITATHTYEVNGEQRTITATHTVTVEIAVSSVKVKDNKTNITLAGSESTTVEILVAGDGSFDPANNAIDLGGYDSTLIDVQPDSQNARLLTVTAKAAGTTTITVASVADPTKKVEIKITVQRPQLKLALSAAMLDVSKALGMGFTLSLQGGKTLADINDLQVAVDNELFTVTGTNGNYTVAMTADARKALTLAQMQATYTVTATGTVGGVAVDATPVTFTLKYSFALTFDLSNAANGEIDRTKIASADYTFALANVPNVPYTVTFESQTEGFAVTDGKVTSAVDSGRVEVLATVTLFGSTDAQSYTYTKVQTYTVVDSTALTATLYNGAYVGDGTDTVLAKKDTSNAVLAIDFDGTTTAQKVITLVVDFADAPSALTANIDNFVISPNAALTQNGQPRFVGRKLIIEYLAAKDGDIQFSVHTAQIGGVVYIAPAVRATLTAAAPNFAAPATVVLDPGESKTVATDIIVTQSATNFKGTLRYKDFTVIGAAPAAIVAVNTNGVVTAATNMGGGSAILRFTVEVTSGVFADREFTFSVPVTVANYGKPSLNIIPPSQDNLFDESGTPKTIDFNSYVHLSHPDADSDAKLSTITYSVNRPSISGSSYTLPADWKNGVHDTVSVQATVTDGFYKGLVLYGSFTIVVKPVFEQSDFVVTGGKTVDGTIYVAPGEKLNFAVSRKNVTMNNLTVVYTVNPNVGTVTTYNDADYQRATFTAGRYAGTAAVTAQLNVAGGIFDGVSKEVTFDICVTGLALASGKSLTVNPGDTIDLADYFVPGSVTTTITDISGLQGVRGTTLTVPKDANFGSTKITIPFTVTATNGSGDNAITYTGSFELTVAPVAIPTFTVEHTVSGKVHTYTLNSGLSDTNAYTFAAMKVVSGGDLCTHEQNGNVYTVTENANTLGGTVVLQFGMTVTGDAYTGTEYDKTFVETVTFTVEKDVAAAEPTIAPIWNLEAKRILPNVSNAESYSVSYKQVSGAENVIKLYSDGTYDIIAEKTDGEQTWTLNVQVTVVITDGYYKDKILTQTVSETVTLEAKQTAPTLGNFKPTLDLVDGLFVGLFTENGLPEGIEVTSYAVAANSANQGLLTVLSGKMFRLDESKVKALTADATVKLTVNYKITSGDHAGETDSTTVDVTVPKYPSFTTTVNRNADKLGGSFATTIARGTVTYVSGHSALTVNGNTFTVTPSETQQTVTVTATLNGHDSFYKGHAFTWSFSVDIDALPTLTATVADGSITPSIANGFGAIYAYQVKEGAAHIELDKTSGATNTYTLKQTAVGQNIVVTVTATLGTGVYGGKTVTCDVTIPTPAVPTLTATAEDGSITPSLATELNDACTYAVTTGNEYVKTFGASTGAYTLKQTAAGKNIVVTVTATVGSGVYRDETVTCDVTIPTPAVPTLTATVANGSITPSLAGATATSYAYDKGTNSLITLSATSGDSVTYTLAKEAVGQNVTVIVSATIGSGVYSGEAVTYNVTIPTPPMPAFTVTAADGTFTLPTSGFDTFGFTPKTGATHIELDATAHTYTLKKTAVGQVIVVTVSAKVDGGVYDDQEVSADVTVVAPLLPTLTANLNGDTITPIFTSGYTAAYAYAVTQNSAYVSATKSESDNTATVEFVKVSAENRTAVVTVTATVQGGVYNGLEFTTTVNVPVTATALQITGAKFEDGKITASVNPSQEGATVAYTYSQCDQFTVTNGTVSPAAGYTLTANGTSAIEVKVSITATVTGGEYNGKSVTETDAVTVSVYAIQYELTLDTTNKLAFTADGVATTFSVTSVTATVGETAITCTYADDTVGLPDGYEWDAEESEENEAELTVTVTSDGKTYNQTFTRYIKAIQPEETDPPEESI